MKARREQRIQMWRHIFDQSRGFRFDQNTSDAANPHPEFLRDSPTPPFVDEQPPAMLAGQRNGFGFTRVQLVGCEELDAGPGGNKDSQPGVRSAHFTGHRWRNDDLAIKPRQHF